MLKNAKNMAKTFLKIKLQKFLLKLFLPLILFLLIILIIVSPLLLFFMGNDTGSIYPVKFEDIEGNYGNDLQGWANFLMDKNQKLLEKAAENAQETPETKDRRGESPDSYTNITYKYYTNEGQAAYVTNNTKEIISMMMVYFEQEYSDASSIFRYLNRLFNASHHITYEESPLYGCSAGCAERTYYCSDSLEGIYDSCFSVPEGQAARTAQHRLYEQHDGCPEHYEDKVFYCNDGTEIEKASDYRKELYNRYHKRGGCILKHGIRYDTHAFCEDYSKIFYLQFTITGESWMPKADLSFNWNVLKQRWEFSSGRNIHIIWPNWTPGIHYLTPDKNGSRLVLKYNQGLNRYEYYNSCYHCKEYTCPGHVENVPGTCLGNHVEKICYGHVDLEISICVDTFPQIYNDDDIGNFTGNARPGESLGIFRITAYCPCSRCCGRYANGITASGTVATEGRTIAVDPAKIPYGTKLVINGHIYVAEDCGSGVNGNHIDLFMSSHERALQWGLQHLEVFYAAADSDSTDNSDETDENTRENQTKTFVFTGWDEDARDWVDCLYDMDWEELYGIRLSQSSNGNMPDNNIGHILESIPDGTNEVRAKIVETAVSMTGKIPYCWGGAARSPGISGIPAAGLDCSHFVDWVYWTAIGNHLGNGNTEILWGVSKNISQNNLKPGDLGFRYVPAGYGGIGGTAGHTNHVGIYVGKDESGNEIWVHENGTADNVSAGTYNGFSYYRRVLNDET